MEAVSELSVEAPIGDLQVIVGGVALQGPHVGGTIKGSLTVEPVGGWHVPFCGRGLSCVDRLGWLLSEGEKMWINRGFATVQKKEV